MLKPWLMSGLLLALLLSCSSKPKRPASVTLMVLDRDDFSEKLISLRTTNPQVQDLIVNGDMEYALPEALCQLTELESFSVSGGQSYEVSIVFPECLTDLKKLKVLNIDGATDKGAFSKNPFPAKLGEMPSVEKVMLERFFTFKTFPVELKKFKNMKVLESYMNYELTTLPEWIGEFEKLEEMKLDRNFIKAFPKSVHQLKNLKKVSLRNNRMKIVDQHRLREEFPGIAFDFSDDGEFDDSSGNEIEVGKK